MVRDMSLKHFPNFVLAIATMLLLIGSFYAPSLYADDNIERLRKNYAAAHNEHDRLQVAIEAIDLGLICSGCKVSVVDRIFDTSISDDPLSPAGPFTFGGVHFREQEIVDNPKEQIALTGWYLNFEYDSDRTIVTYYLSNMGK